jgi:hypothetical protein
MSGYRAKVERLVLGERGILEYPKENPRELATIILT